MLTPESRVLSKSGSPLTGSPEAGHGHWARPSYQSEATSNAAHGPLNRLRKRSESSGRS